MNQPFTITPSELPSLPLDERRELPDTAARLKFPPPSASRRAHIF